MLIGFLVGTLYNMADDEPAPASLCLLISVMLIVAIVFQSINL
jgi:hypothetical protein